MSGFTPLNGSSTKLATTSVAAVFTFKPQHGTAEGHAHASAPTPAPGVECASAPAPPPASAPVMPPSAAHAPVQFPAEAPAPVLVPVQAPVADAAALVTIPVQAAAALPPRQRESWPTQGLEHALSAPTPNESFPEMCKRADSHGGQTRLSNQPAQCTQKSAESTHKRTPEATTIVSHQQSNGNHHQTKAHKSMAQAPAPQDQAPLRPVTIHASAAQLVQSQPAGQVEHTSATSQNDYQAAVQARALTDWEQSSGAVVSHGPKKRKRLFSQRTKTGCLTCRARRKKCDEAKPQCNNCIKGSHRCSGNPPRRGVDTSTMTENEAELVTLEPKNPSSLPPAFGDRGVNDYQQHHDGHAPPASSAHRAALLGISHAQARPRSMAVTVSYNRRHPTQKEEMLQGGYFYHYDWQLSSERDRAAAACWRFNTLTYPPTNGVSTEERARLFLEILQPQKSTFFPDKEASSRNIVGRVGYHVAVESPFHCDYGYNISIGNNVSIGKGCTMSDAGTIHIGDNCIIGPNVSMYTIELSTDPKHRQGGHGTQLSKGIVIESDCWIGGGTIVLPGSVVGRGSTIIAGSVVTKDVPPFTIVAGNPARVLRGIMS